MRIFYKRVSAVDHFSTANFFFQFQNFFNLFFFNFFNFISEKKVKIFLKKKKSKLGDSFSQLSNARVKGLANYMGRVGYTDIRNIDS